MISYGRATSVSSYPFLGLPRPRARFPSSINQCLCALYGAEPKSSSSESWGNFRAQEGHGDLQNPLSLRPVTSSNTCSHRHSLGSRPDSSLNKSCWTTRLMGGSEVRFASHPSKPRADDCAMLRVLPCLLEAGVCHAAVDPGSLIKASEMVPAGALSGEVTIA